MSIRQFVVFGKHFGKIGETPHKYYGENAIIELFDIDTEGMVGARYPDRAGIALPIAHFDLKMQRRLLESMRKRSRKRLHAEGERPKLTGSTRPKLEEPKRSRPTLNGSRPKLKG